MALLLVLYCVSFACEIVGALLLITDIRSDQRDLRLALEKSATASRAEGLDFGGVSIGGMFGAAVAQSMGKQNVVEEFTIARLAKGYRKRWVASAILVVGIVLSAAANVLSIF